MSLAFALAGIASAQTPPTATQIAAAETALHCSEIVARVEREQNVGRFTQAEIDARKKSLDFIRIRYMGTYPLVTLAGYTPETIAQRREVHRARIAAMKDLLLENNITSCALGDSPISPIFLDDSPSQPHAFAMAGRGANDVLYLDTASFYRDGGTVSGWQLYIFRTDQMVDSNPVKAQWTPFRVVCMGTPEIATYGSAYIADPKKPNLPLVANRRTTANRKKVEPNTFGAATWMIACDVTRPTQTYSTLAAAAEHAASVFALQAQQPTPAPN